MYCSVRRVRWAGGRTRAESGAVACTWLSSHWAWRQGTEYHTRRPAKPAREHATTIDSEIQTWRLDANFSGYGTRGILRHRWTASHSFSNNLHTERTTVSMWAASHSFSNNLRTERTTVSMWTASHSFSNNLPLSKQQWACWSSLA